MPTATILDEIRVILGALTANQILAHYDNELTNSVNGAWDIGEAGEIPVGGGARTTRIAIRNGIGIF